MSKARLAIATLMVVLFVGVAAGSGSVITVSEHNSYDDFQDGDTGDWWVDDSLSAIGSGTYEYTSASHEGEATHGYVEYHFNDSAGTFPGEGTITWQSYSDGEWNTVAEEDMDSSEDRQITQVTELPGDEHRVKIDVELTDSDQYVEVYSEGVEYRSSSPEIIDTSPEDGAQVTESPTLSVEVDHDDFDSEHVDELDVDFEINGGEEEYSTTATEAGTVEWTPQLDPGEYQWSAIVTDEQGDTAETQDLTFVVPGELEVRDEVANELIDDTDVDVTFFSSDGEHIETRSTSDGTVDMEGLPHKDFIISVSADQYLTRTTYIESIGLQESAYLLHEDEDSVLITFDLDDRTERFPDSETRLVIQKAIETNGETEYRSIAGDYFGADGEFSVDLLRGDRLRLSIENDDGETRALGDFTPETDDFVTLDVGQVSIGTPGDRGYSFTASTTETEDGQEQARINYIDQDGLTDQFEYRIYERNNESHVLQDWVTVTDTQIYESHIDLPDDDTNWVVEYEITRDGETISDTIPVGGVSSLDWPISGAWLSAFGLFAIVGTASLFGGAMSRTGAVFVAVMAFALTILGVLTIPYPMLMLAAFMAVVFKFAEAGDGGIFT